MLFSCIYDCVCSLFINRLLESLLKRKENEIPGIPGHPPRVTMKTRKCLLQTNQLLNLAEHLFLLTTQMWIIQHLQVTNSDTK